MNVVKGQHSTFNKTVLLFKAPKEDGIDPFIQELESSQYSVTCVPVLEFTFINIPRYTELLKHPESYSAIVFTSQRSVEATVEALQPLKGYNGHDKLSSDQSLKCLDMPCYVVGASTQKAAKEAGFSPIESECGNANYLADFICKDLAVSEKPILYPCGNLRQETLPKKLKESGYCLKEMVVYETRRSSSIEHHLENTVKTQGLPNFVVYFSPSGVEYTFPLISTHLDSFSKTWVIAIGPSTQKALEEKGISVSAVSSKPDAKSLLMTVKEIDSS